MSNLRLRHKYVCDGCGNMAESHIHELVVDFAGASQTVVVNFGGRRQWIFSQEEWNALQEIGRLKDAKK